MSIVWIAFVLITGRVLATSTLFADRFAAATRRSRRLIWATGLIVTTVWPAIAFGMLRLARTAAAHGLPLTLPSGGLPLKLYLPRGVAPAWIDQTFLILWAGASAALIVRLVFGIAVLRRWRRTLPVVDIDGVPARLSPTAGPAVIGFWAGELMIPSWVLTLERSARSLIVRHEQQHVATNDARLLWLAALLPSLVPWNVFSWWQASRLRLAVEMDCDARVLRDLPRPAEYARLLVDIAERSVLAPSVPAVMPTLIGSARRLRYRLVAIQEHQASRPRIAPIAHALVALIALGVALAIETPVPPSMRAALRAPATSAGRMHLLGAKDQEVTASSRRRENERDGQPRGWPSR